jgi:DNA polymerase
MKLIRDYETRSAVDLLTTGAQKYARHPSTDAICLAIKCVGYYDQTFIWVNPHFAALLPAGHNLPLVSTEWLTREMSILPLNDGFMTESHNDGFEQAIDEHIMLARHSIPLIKLGQRQCSMAQAAVNALPRGLGKLGAALELSDGHLKDDEGHKLMLKMCKPATMYAKDWKTMRASYGDFEGYRAARLAYKNAKSNKGKAYSTFVADHWAQYLVDGVDPNSLLKWHEDPLEILMLCRYCIQDVESEYAVGCTMPALNLPDTDLWRLDQTINYRGVCIDVKGAQNAIRMVSTYKAHMEQELSAVTNGAIQSVGQHAALKAWCAAKGVPLPNTAKDTLEYYIKKVALPPEVKRALEIRVACGQTSVTKYEAMVRAACEDNRVRGVFQYSAAATGRWTAGMVQLHNMPRGTIKLKTDEDIDAAYKAMACGWPEVQCLYGDVMGLAASAVRGAIVAAEGCKLMVSDFKSVEARKTVWMAGDEKGLQVFTDGLDAYKVAAAGIFGVPYDQVTDEQRQVGKVGILSLGFGGGIGAYSSMSRKYNIDLETLPPLILTTAKPVEIEQAKRTAETYQEELERRITLKIEKNIGKASFLDRMSLEAAMSCDIIKQRWRRDHKLVVDFWATMEGAAIAAVKFPGTGTQAGRYIKFQMSSCRRFLLMWLPSGRCLRYYKPRIVIKKKFGRNRDTLMYWRVVSGVWVLSETYGGKIFENAVQASSNDLLRYSMFTVENHGFPIVMHVHDEAGSEILTGSRTLEEYNYLMAMHDHWAEGMPMGSDGWHGRRFKK